MRTLWILLLIWLVPACKPAVHSTQTQIIPAEHQPTIAFLAFRFTRDTANGKNSAALVSKKVVTGSFKPSSQSVYPYQITISQLDDQGAILFSNTQEHPLLRVVEFTGIDNQLMLKPAALQTADYFVRVQLMPLAKRIKIEEVIEGEYRFLLAVEL